MADGGSGAEDSRVLTIVQGLRARRSLSGPIALDQPLSEVGLTSLDMVGLMLGVEAAFDVEIPQADMTPENFRTVGSIERLVGRLLRPEGQAA
jgi:acyl carrier protein